MNTNYFNWLLENNIINESDILKDVKETNYVVNYKRDFNYYPYNEILKCESIKDIYIAIYEYVEEHSQAHIRGLAFNIAFDHLVEFVNDEKKAYEIHLENDFLIEDMISYILGNGYIELEITNLHSIDEIYEICINSKKRENERNVIK